MKIPCGLHIYDREIDLMVEPVDGWSMVNIYSGDRYIGKLERTAEIDAAIQAAIEYERSIEDVGVESRD